MKKILIKSIFGIFLITGMISCQKDDSEILKATSINLLSGGSQQAEAGKQLAKSIEVIVKDQNGSPFKGEEIHFSLIEGSVSEEDVTTDSEGKASVKWTLGASQGEQRLIITTYEDDGTTPLKGSPLEVTANSILVATSIELFSGEAQQAEAEKQLAKPIFVMVKDQNGNPFKGEEIHFFLTEGSVSEVKVTTDSEGKASVNWTLGASEGLQDLNITAYKDDGTTPLTGSPLEVTAKSILIAASIELLSEAALKAEVKEQIADPIKVMVKDKYGKPLEGALVRWIISEGSLIYEDTPTDIDGKASCIWTLGLCEIQSLFVTVSETKGIKHESCEPLCVNATASLPIVTDIDGNEYSTVRIGKQIWIGENLRTTRYSDGTPIPLVENETYWANLTDLDKAYCYYDNVPNDDNRYGLLYTWAAATNGEGYSSTNPSGIQGVSPEGWHIPSYSEWDQLREYLGGADIAGGKMKEAGTDNWHSPNTEATNESAFTVLPAGYRSKTGTFMFIGDYSHFWSTTENCLPCGPADWWLSKDISNFYHGGSSYPNSGYSVRCLMDSE